MWYVTSYATKKQAKSHNILALMAKTYTYHEERLQGMDTDSLQDAQRKMIFQVMQTINQHQELVVVMVISYLMG